jgi:hypothetical protein
MKEFKTLPKMKCGGKVKKYETGGEVKSTERKWGGKTAIGDAAAQTSWNKNWLKNETKEATFDRIIQAKDEADDEAYREANRGISPENRKKRGGKVTKKNK